MKETLESLEKIHFDHTLWLNQLTFALMEIELHEDRLISFIKESSEPEIEDELQTLYKKFEEKKEEVNELKLKIRMHVINNNRLKKSNGALSMMTNSDHQQTKDSIDFFRQDFEKLKKDFQQISNANGI